MATQLVPENLNVTGARLPAQYEAARTALAACASVDECKTWANKAQALASYARQAEDDTLHKTAIRIQSRAIRRAGELLTALKAQGVRTDLAEPVAAPAPPAVGKPTPQLPVGDLPKSATAAAREAGMSEHQQKTAMRVASVPAAHFEAAVESAEPPTVTRLADMGRRTSARQDEPAPPGFSEAIQLEGHTRRLAEFAGQHAAAFVAGAVADHSRRELRRYVAQCRRYLAAIAPLIRENRDGL